MTAIRTTTTRTTTTLSAPSAEINADSPGHADLFFQELVQAYYDCRRSKRNSTSALTFEQNLERNLIQLRDELLDGTYTPGKSICFVVMHPKPREVWAADFRDRIVHHLLYNHIAPSIEATFIADSCACMVGRGTLYAARRLESKVRSITQNWSRPAYYLKCDVANFFVSINKPVLLALLRKRIAHPWWLALAEQVLMHDPRSDFEFRGDPRSIHKVPGHKRLLNQHSDYGLPIGNLSSQFFANIYLDVLDQFAKHQLRARRYIRYVDDFLLLHESPQWLTGALRQIEEFLPERLGIQLNPTKTIIQPIDRGVDFVGHVIKPWRRTIRRRTVRQALSRVTTIPDEDLAQTANSYFGYLDQASHSHADRADLARIILHRSRPVTANLKKIGGK